MPSASAAPGSSRHQPAGYNLYRIAGAPGAWSCEVVSRGAETATGRFVELARQRLVAQL